MIDLKSVLDECGNASCIKLEVSLKDLVDFCHTIIEEAAELNAQHISKDEAEDEFLTRIEVAKRLKVSLGTLWLWNKKKILVGEKIGNQVRYRKSSVDKCFASNKKED